MDQVFDSCTEVLSLGVVKEVVVNIKGAGSESERHKLRGCWVETGRSMLTGLLRMLDIAKCLGRKRNPRFVRNGNFIFRLRN